MEVGSICWHGRIQAVPRKWHQEEHHKSERQARRHEYVRSEPHMSSNGGALLDRVTPADSRNVSLACLCHSRGLVMTAQKFMARTPMTSKRSIELSPGMTYLWRVLRKLLCRFGTGLISANLPHLPLEPHCKSALCHLFRCPDQLAKSLPLWYRCRVG